MSKCLTLAYHSTQSWSGRLRFSLECNILKLFNKVFTRLSSRCSLFVLILSCWLPWSRKQKVRFFQWMLENIFVQVMLVLLLIVAKGCTRVFSRLEALSVSIPRKAFRRDLINISWPRSELFVGQPTFCTDHECSRQSHVSLRMIYVQEKNTCISPKKCLKWIKIFVTCLGIK